MSLLNIFLKENSHPEDLESDEPELFHLYEVLVDDAGDEDELGGYNSEDLIEKFHETLGGTLYAFGGYKDEHTRHVDKLIESKHWRELVSYFINELGMSEDRIKNWLLSSLRDKRSKIRRTEGNTRDHFEFQSILGDEVLFHFTDHPQDILQHGFQRGVSDPTKLGITTSFGRDSELKIKGGYNFAYDEDSLKYAVESDLGKSYRYGEHIIAFKANAIKAWHEGDGENQCIFWGKNARHICLVSIEEVDHPNKMDTKVLSVTVSGKEVLKKVYPSGSKGALKDLKKAFAFVTQVIHRM